MGCSEKDRGQNDPLTQLVSAHEEEKKFIEPLADMDVSSLEARTVAHEAQTQKWLDDFFNGMTYYLHPSAVAGLREKLTQLLNEEVMKQALTATGRDRTSVGLIVADEGVFLGLRSYQQEFIDQMRSMEKEVRALQVPKDPGTIPAPKRKKAEFKANQRFQNNLHQTRLRGRK